jgi:hypothetical protein
MSTHTLAVIGATFGNAKHMASLFNGSGSGRVLRVYRVWLLNNQTSTVTGVLTTFSLRRTSAQSGGTAVTPTKHDTTNASLVAQVLSATGATVTNTADADLRRFMWSNDEPSVSSAVSDELECIVPLNCIWDSTGDDRIQPIVLREGQGVTLQHTGTSAVGICDIFFELTDAAT